MISTKAALTTAVASAFLLATATAGVAATPAGQGAGTTVSQVPATFTPWLLSSTPLQNVQQLVPCGDTMYAVGTISAVGQGTSTYVRSNAFSFSASTGAVTAWAPQVNGPVHSVALSPDCQTAYLGGLFTSVNGEVVKNIVAVDTVTGAVLPGFAHTASGGVDTLKFTHGVVLAGGAFTFISGVPRTRLASLDPVTGKATTYANLSITGSYPNTTGRVYNSQISHDGSRLLIEGVFTSIDGQSRQQVAVLDLGETSATLNGWVSEELNQPCRLNESFYAKGGAWSPDDTAIYVATTGFKPLSGPGSKGTDPRAGLCDAAIEFPATAGPVSHTWINYTGCDSLYAVAADDTNVYIGGHERWADNGFGCNTKGPGAVVRRGLASLDPVTGLATPWDPSRSLGHGANDMLVTPTGLWVASDNFSDGRAQMCGRISNRGGICFLPY